MNRIAGIAGNVCLLIFIALLGVPSAPAIAGQVRSSTGSGLTMTVDASWRLGAAYRRVLVTLTPTAPSATDRTVEIEFLIRVLREPYDQRTVQSVEIPAGSGPVQVSMAVPQSMTGLYQVNAWEAGRKLKSLSQPWLADQGIYAYGVMGRLPQVLVVARETPNLGNLQQALLDATGGNPGQIQGVPAMAGQNIGVGRPAGSPSASDVMTQVAAPAELPRRWIEYSNYDLVLLTLDDLRALEQQTPEAHQALVRWARAGGNLLVAGVGRSWRRLGELERRTGLTSSESSSGKPSQRGWSEPPKPDVEAAKRPQLLGGGSVDGFSAFPSGENAPTTPEPTEAPQNAKRRLAEAVGDLLEGKTPAVWDEMVHSLSGDTAPPFLVHPLGTGTLVAWASNDPCSAPVAEWRHFYDTLGPRRLLWTDRHGLAMFGDNPDFWNFLIPGIGMAPVGMFRVLISLFVIVIGPVNYYLLRRWRRLYLLVVTVPLCALVVTGLLLTYALVADGLGTRVRVRSFTWLDQRSGEAVCWSRLSYYAGLAPSRGLTFSSDLVALPLTFERDIANGTGREILWEDDQRLARGWLNARTPTQLLTVRARASDRQLQLSLSPADSETLQVVNRLGTQVHHLLVRASDDRYYWAERVEAGASAVAHRIDASLAAHRLREAASPHRPSSPNGNSRAYQTNRRNWRVAAAYAGQGSQPNGRLEASLRGIEESSGDGKPCGLEPGQYVAVVASSPEVEVGLPSAQEEASFHVILGTWESRP